MLVTRDCLWLPGYLPIIACFTSFIGSPGGQLLRTFVESRQGSWADIPFCSLRPSNVQDCNLFPIHVLTMTSLMRFCWYFLNHVYSGYVRRRPWMLISSYLMSFRAWPINYSSSGWNRKPEEAQWQQRLPWSKEFVPTSWVSRGISPNIIVWVLTILGDL